MRDPDLFAPESRARANPIGDEGNGERAQGSRPDECAIRCKRRRSLRAGSEPARITDGPVREQGDRCSVGEARCQDHGWENPCRAGLHRGSRPETFFGEGSGLSVFALPGHGHRARAGNEIHRRSNGN